MSKKVLKLAGRRPMLLALIVMATFTIGLLFSGWLTPTPGKAQPSQQNPQPNIESSTNCISEGSVSLDAPTGTPTSCLGDSITVSVGGVKIVPADIRVTTTNSDGSTSTVDTYPNPAYGVTWSASVGSFSASGTGTTATFTPTNGGNGTVSFTVNYTNQTPCGDTESSSTSGGFIVIEIIHQCVATTPTNQARTTIGIGEEVNLSVVGVPSGSVSWAASGGDVNPKNGTSTSFRAPYSANTVTATVTVSYENGSCTLSFTVIPPTGYYVSGITPWLPNGGGVNLSFAGMQLDLWMIPDSVSFGNLNMAEIPANFDNNVSGYFLNKTFFPNGPPVHYGRGAGANVPVGDDNSIGTDNALMGTESTQYQPWSSGGYTWPIPASWFPRDANYLYFYPLTWSDQIFSIDASGNATVQKFGHTATRNTNNIYTTLQ
jgi:hypothetical protein